MSTTMPAIKRLNTRPGMKIRASRSVIPVVRQKKSKAKPWTADKLPGIVTTPDPEIEKYINSPAANL